MCKGSLLQFPILLRPLSSNPNQSLFHIHNVLVCLDFDLLSLTTTFSVTLGLELFIGA